MVFANSVHHLKFFFKFLVTSFILVSLVFNFSSCSSSANHEEEMKFNPALKQTIFDAEQNNPQQVIPVLIKSQKELTSEMKSEVEKTGLIVESVIGEIISANGTAKQIREAAGLTYILTLELSQKRKIN